MKFRDFIEKELVRKAKPDVSLSRSLLNNAKQDIKFLDKIKVNKDSCRKLTTNYYDVLRSILEAVAILDGYKIYSHEAFTYFLKEKDGDLISMKFDRLRKIRNSINYYGKNVSVEGTKENIKKTKRLINSLINKYLSKIE